MCIAVEGVIPHRPCGFFKVSSGSQNTEKATAKTSNLGISKLLVPCNSLWNET